MESAEPIYLDYSTLWTFATCQEQARLSFVRHLQPLAARPAIDFGSAFHKAVDTWFKTSDLDTARTAFVSYLRENRIALPLSMDQDEKRSVERGVYIFEAWVEKWKNEPYKTLHSEVYFHIPLFEWMGRQVFICGKIDRIMQSLITGRIYIHELKTTSMGLSNFANHCKPNHQVTMYDWAGRQHVLDIAGTIWDMIFISSRKPDPKKDKWMAMGVDIAKDFARVETRRSEVDITEFLIDLHSLARSYLAAQDSSAKRWTRNAPKACYMYGGCQFIPVCNSNGNEQIISSLYQVKPWEPWKEGISEPAES